MATLVTSTDVFIGGEISIDTDPIKFESGRNLGPLPTLYDANGKYVEPVNQWFIHLVAVKRLEDLSSYARALRRYWEFLDKHELVWDHFPPIKALKPTYRFRNDDLLKNTKTGQLAYSTANTYMGHVVQFYLWAARERYYPLTESHKPFEIEFVRVKNNSMLANIMPEFVVQTSDLRIKVPKDATSKTVRDLNPLSQDSLHMLSQRLRAEPPEIRLIIMLGAQCGLRIEEAAGFTLTAFNQAVPRADSRTHYEITIGPGNGVPTKYSKTRTIEITDTLLRELRRYAIDERRLTRLDKLRANLNQHRELFSERDRPPLQPLGLNMTKLEALMVADRYEPLFISQQGNPYLPKVVGARFGEIRRSMVTIGIPFPHRFHDLRCSYATYRLHSLLAAGLAPAEALDLLMQWMGHKNESTIWKYLRYLKRKEALKEKISMLDNIMHQALQEACNE
ncbi:site-specific integrase [Aeromonas veronii]|uniref:tyrosine-type recombinase/integrase n=1 Tax=Aeromonas veronii TaxID=654 RepID=UPI00130249F8|nr:site-specific integrase [Aeromonas veronii]KAE9625303.1 tyrosine-type recombinase/integrase [Aeromonas veronii]MBW3778046.1 site-specific integrase [Aeromonas veronii]